MLYLLSGYEMTYIGMWDFGHITQFYFGTFFSFFFLFYFFTFDRNWVQAVWPVNLCREWKQNWVILSKKAVCYVSSSAIDTPFRVPSGLVKASVRFFALLDVYTCQNYFCWTRNRVGEGVREHKSAVFKMCLGSFLALWRSFPSQSSTVPQCYESVVVWLGMFSFPCPVPPPHDR